MRVLLVDTDDTVSVHDEPTAGAILKMISDLLSQSDFVNSAFRTIEGTTFINVTSVDDGDVVTFAGIIVTPADLPIEEAIMHLCQTAEIAEVHGNRFDPPAVLAPYLA